MFRDNSTKRELEEQRRQAVKVLGRGFTPKEVSDIFDVAVDTVRRWKRTFDEEGMEGLEANYRFTNDDCARRLENISTDYLREVLTEVEDGKPTQKIMLAINYKEEDLVTQKKLAERYGISRSTVRDWLFCVERLEDESHENTLPDKRKIPAIGREREGVTLPERTNKELEARRKEAIRAIKNGSSPQEVADVFDVEPNTVRGWRLDYENNGFDGLETVPNDFSENDYLKNISSGYLRDILSKVEEPKAAKRVMLALTYKEETGITQSRLAERYGINETTIWKWLTCIKKLENEPFESVIYDESISGPSRELSDKELSELNELLEAGPDAHGFGSFIWTSNQVSDLIESEFNVSLSSSTALRYLKELEWNDENLIGRKRLGGIDRNHLLSKLKDVAHRPTQRVMIAILYKEGFSVPVLADWFGRGQSTLYRWFNRIEREPLDEAIHNTPSPGRSRKLSEKELSELENILHEGAEASGFAGQLWTGPRVAEVIDSEFDVSISRSTACDYLHQIGWSNKKPQPVSRQCDEASIESFRNEEWDEIRQNAQETNQTIVFIDETKFRLLPTFKSTWAPKGERATVETSGLFAYIAVIGALSYNPKTQSLGLHWRKQRYGFETQSIHTFLNNITDIFNENITFLLDNWSPHKSALDELGEELNKESAGFNIEWFPKYASGLNPVDKAWGHAKYNGLANYAPKDLDELEKKVEEALTDIRTDESVLRYCIKDAGLDIEA